MACRFLDGFDYYSTSDLSRKYNDVGDVVAIVSSPIRHGLGALRCASAIEYVTKTIDDQATWIIGFGFRIDVISLDNIVFQILDAGTVQVDLRVNGDGTLELLRNSSSVTGGNSTLTINVNTWYYIEVKVTIANSIGANTCQVRVNGVEYINVTTGQDMQNTANATANGFKFRNNRGSVNVYFDDLYIFDSLTANNNDFAGDSAVDTHLANGNGTTSDFSGSDGNSVNNFELVDEPDTDDDVTYVESATPGDIDLFDFEDFSLTPQAIDAVQINMVARKDNVGGRTIRSITRPVAANFNGDTKSLSSGSYSNEIQIYDLNPATSLAWTEATFNATEFGIEIVA